jgi:hypothetical protein
MTDYNDFKTEFKALFIKGEDAIFPDDKDGMNERLRYFGKFKKNINRVCYINCEFCPDSIEDVHLHYSLKYWGSKPSRRVRQSRRTKQFNDLLTKYSYSLEWDDSCNAHVYIE